MSKNYRNLLCLLILLTCCFNLCAQSLFNFASDYALFKNDDGKIIIEFYYSFNQEGLKFVQVDKGYEAAGFISIQIINKWTESEIVNKKFKIPVEVKDTAGYNKLSRLIGQLDIIIDSGDYVFKVNAKDFNIPNDSIYSEESFTLSRFPLNRVISSSIQLSTDIKKSLDINNVFYKNTLEVEPNPLRIFGNNFSKLYYYVELYNLKREYITENYFLTWNLQDSLGNILRSRRKKYELKGDSRVDYGNFDLNDILTGNYELFLKIEDENNNKILESKKSFYVYNSVIDNIVNTGDGSAYLTSEYMKFSEDEVDQEFEYSKYLMKESVINNYEKLKDIDSKRRFMFNFWRPLDSNPMTPLNEYKKDYFDRIKFANKNFKGELIEGWKTDRGRIIAIYGRPDEVESHPFEGETRAYEIWSYNNLEGGVIFVFADLKSDNGDYSLIHSTKRNELRNDDWQVKIRIR